ncbi:MAG: HAD family hydrolase [Pseudomonadota bacterium]
MYHAITTISLDLDDTLWPVRPVIHAAERALRAWLDEHYPRIYQTFDRDAVMAMRRELVARYPERAHDLTFVRKQLLLRMAMSAGYDDSLVEPAFELFDTHRNRVTFYDDAIPALEQLHQRYTLVALTNGNASLNKTGIARYFKAKVSAIDVGAAKPDVRMFDGVARAAGAAPAEILHIGDDPHLDVHGARCAGQLALWLNRTRSSWPAALGGEPATISDLHALVSLLLGGAHEH